MEKKNLTEVRSLPVNLTPAEIQDKAHELAKATLDIAEHEKRLKDVQADFKAKIATLEANSGTLSRAISNGYEYREVDCLWEYKWDHGVKVLVRQDTYEEVKRENITQKDRQDRLDLEPAA